MKRLDVSLAVKVALRHGQLSLARRLRRATWAEVEKMPSHLTGEQRRDFGGYRMRVRLLEEAARQRCRQRTRPPGGWAGVDVVVTDGGT